MIEASSSKYFLPAMAGVRTTIEGLGDGSASSFNMTLWLALLGGIAAILGGGWALNAKGWRWPAIGLLSILGAPAFLFGLFLLLVVITQPNWR